MIKGSGKMLRHVVLLKFKDGTAETDIACVENAFRELPEKIDAIHSFEFGTNVSPENLAQGFTHCFFLSFLTAPDRDSYLPHPAHKEFGNVLSPHVDKVLVVDYFVDD
ncbi:MAG: Dabb family protein [Deltaproteobacteria bacterium]|nr:Dabb family protein [Deltaproteobacteria bacterium]